MFAILLIVQGFVFAQYPRDFFDSKWCNLIVLSVLPALSLLVYIKNKQRPNRALQHLWQVWSLYVVFVLIPMVVMIWGFIAQKFNTNSFFGPNVLKITVCASPMLALLLLSTASDSREHKDLIGRLSGSVALELFDHIGILDMLLARNDSFKSLPSAFRFFVISAVCFSLLLTPIEMLEHKSLTHPRSKNRRCFDLMLIGLQMLVVNIKMLVIRLVMWLYYNHDASIFMAKNVIVLAICVLEIFKICQWCGYKQNHSYSRVETDEDDYV